MNDVFVRASWAAQAAGSVLTALRCCAETAMWMRHAVMNLVAEPCSRICRSASVFQGRRRATGRQRKRCACSAFRLRVSGMATPALSESCLKAMRAVQAESGFISNKMPQLTCADELMSQQCRSKAEDLAHVPLPPPPASLRHASGTGSARGGGAASDTRSISLPEMGPGVYAVGGRHPMSYSVAAAIEQLRSRHQPQAQPLQHFQQRHTALLPPAQRTLSEGHTPQLLPGISAMRLPTVTPPIGSSPSGDPAAVPSAQQHHSPDTSGASEMGMRATTHRLGEFDIAEPRFATQASAPQLRQRGGAHFGGEQHGNQPWRRLTSQSFLDTLPVVSSAPDCQRQLVEQHRRHYGSNLAFGPPASMPDPYLGYGAPTERLAGSDVADPDSADPMQEVTCCVA